MNEQNQAAMDKPLPNFPHAGDCNCADCDIVYYERKAIRQREIDAIEAIIAKNNAEPFGPRVISIIFFIVAMLSFLAGVMIDRRFDIF